MTETASGKFKIIEGTLLEIVTALASYETISFNILAFARNFTDLSSDKASVLVYFPGE